MLIDLPVTLISCLLFSIVIYIMVGWPMEMDRFSIFFIVSLLIVMIAQAIGLLIGTLCNVIVSKKKYYYYCFLKYSHFPKAHDAISYLYTVKCEEKGNFYFTTIFLSSVREKHTLSSPFPLPAHTHLLSRMPFCVIK